STGPALAWRLDRESSHHMRVLYVAFACVQAQSLALSLSFTATEMPTCRPIRSPCVYKHAERPAGSVWMPCFLWAALIKLYPILTQIIRLCWAVGPLQCREQTSRHPGVPPRAPIKDDDKSRCAPHLRCAGHLL